jgi:hypothetical protein
MDARWRMRPIALRLEQREEWEHDQLRHKVRIGHASEVPKPFLAASADVTEGEGESTPIWE